MKSRHIARFAIAAISILGLALTQPLGEASPLLSDTLASSDLADISDAAELSNSAKSQVGNEHDAPLDAPLLGTTKALLGHGPSSPLALSPTAQTIDSVETWTAKMLVEFILFECLYVALGVVLVGFGAGWPGLVFFLSPAAFLSQLGRSLAILAAPTDSHHHVLTRIGVALPFIGIVIGVYVTVLFHRNKLQPDRKSSLIVSLLPAAGTAGLLYLVLEGVVLTQEATWPDAYSSAAAIPAFIHSVVLLSLLLVFVPLALKWLHLSAVLGVVTYGAGFLVQAVTLGLTWRVSTSSDKEQDVSGVAGLVAIFATGIGLTAVLSAAGVWYQMRWATRGQDFWTGKQAWARTLHPQFDQSRTTLVGSVHSAAPSVGRGKV